ncbi:hypothetical protein GCM10023335_67560 [Streptomyces siamensis]|uniref:Uncharacterized protein n=2 Tax=Streptomyces siamensis TaxID=1274986 RepID=A0ABP9JE05_9ACTN
MAQPAHAAQAVQAVHTRTAVLALHGTFLELGAGAEPIDITGSLRVTVVTRSAAGGGGTAHIVSSLSRTTGIGQTSGATYRFIGADVDDVAYPPGPIAPLPVNPTFLKFWPPGPIVPPNPIVPPHPIQPVSVAVTLAADGAINAITASIDDGGIDN